MARFGPSCNHVRVSAATERPPGNRTGVGRVVVAGCLLGVAALGTAISGPWRPPFGANLPPPPQPPPPEVARVTEAARDLDVIPVHAGVRWILLALVLLLALLFVAVLRWSGRPVLARLRRPRQSGGSDGAAPGSAGVRRGAAEPDLPTLLEGVEDADAVVGADGVPADAVVAAWVALERAAARSGVPREPAHTPTEFTVDVLDRTAADREATRTLLGLYLAARFGDELLTAHDVETARAALAALRRTLTMPAVAGPAVAR
jgi:hypothetical protein